MLKDGEETCGGRAKRAKVPFWRCTPASQGVVHPSKTVRNLLAGEKNRNGDVEVRAFHAEIRLDALHACGGEGVPV